MPDAPVVQFPGVVQATRLHITRSHGVSPNTLVLEIAPQASDVATYGDLVVYYGGVIIRWRDCIVDSASIQYDARNRIVALILLDRRWKWRYGHINGHYNRRDESGNLVKAEDPNEIGTVVDSERTPQELATLLLQAMGEEDYDISALPNDTRPEVLWDNAVPALELAELAETFACRVHLGLDGKVWIRRVGEGNNLPINLPLVRLVQSIDPKERPDVIAVATSPTLYQTDLLLEAVGEDADGAIKPIAEMSVAPHPNDNDGGWKRYFAPFLGGFVFNDDNVRRLAEKSVFRWYRIVTPFSFPEQIGINEDEEPEFLEVTNLDQILPILDIRATTVVEDGRTKNQPALVYGKWYDTDTQANTVTTLFPLADDVASTATEVVPVGFAIDQAKGVLKFSQPIYQLDSDFFFTAATLRFRCAWQYRTKSGGWRHIIVQRTQPNPLGTKRLVLRNPDIVPVKRLEYNTNVSTFNSIRLETNEEEVQSLADEFLDVAETAFVTDRPLMAVYAGFFPIELDGAIRQVQYVLDSGGAAISTTVHRQQDVDSYGNYSYARLRNEQRLVAIQNATRGKLIPYMRRDLRRESIK